MRRHILNVILPVSLRNRLRSFALSTVPSMRHLDMPKRLRHMKSLGFNPTVIFDIGAATGDWARLAASIWPAANIVGFEPNAHTVESLEQTKRELPRFDYFRGFLGASKQVVRYENKSYVTSLLDTPKTDAKLDEAEMSRLDDLISDQKLAPPQFMKLDVQGYELEVLKGAEKAMQACDAILMEVSFSRFFPGMPTADEVIDFMRERGFIWYDVMGILRSGLDDSLAQMDFMFLRADHPLRPASESATLQP
jgi:FkbM family methyltransferase